MIAELGHFALILAFTLAVTQALLPLAGAALARPAWMAVARPAAGGQFLFLAVAFAVLGYGFVVNDFSIAYVAANSNSALPLHYRLSAVWGAHEGSLLLWSLVHAGWGFAVALFSRSLPQAMAARVLGVMGAVSVGFLLFMLLTSNPFTRLVPVPGEGADLNPLLQDFGLIVHPPMLYMGYVGFSVAFAFAIAALLGGRLDAAWARWSRPWATVAWMFLTAGIALGSWWAYYELGWGGWWFWDPVENASFMPWLVGTALIHSLAATDKRGVFKSWTLLLAILAFSLSLLGTFLVRSGVLTSVHAFATDPARGVFILAFLGLVIGSSLALYAWRAPAMSGSAGFAPLSRETTLLANNIVLTVAAGTILLGTLYPLALEAFGQGKLSVGPPYFNTVFVPLMLVLLALLGAGALVRWKLDRLGRLAHALRLAALAALALGVAAAPMLGAGAAPGVMLGLALAAWVVLGSVQALRAQLGTAPDRRAAALRLPRSVYGMLLAHAGLAVTVVGVTMSSALSGESFRALQPGETAELGGYQFRFDGVRDLLGANYRATEAQITVTRGGAPVTLLRPQKRVYLARNMPMTEAAIDPGLGRDLYAALGDPLANGAWSVRLYHKPFVRWIWLGAIFMVVGGVFAASDRRYRLARQTSPAVPGYAVAAAGARS